MAEIHRMLNECASEIISIKLHNYTKRPMRPSFRKKLMTAVVHFYRYKNALFPGNTKQNKWNIYYLKINHSIRNFEIIVVNENRKAKIYGLNVLSLRKPLSQTKLNKEYKSGNSLNEFNEKRFSAQKWSFWLKNLVYKNEAFC